MKQWSDDSPKYSTPHITEVRRSDRVDPIRSKAVDEIMKRLDSGVAQIVEQTVVNRQVAGAGPASGAIHDEASETVPCPNCGDPAYSRFWNPNAMKWVYRHDDLGIPVYHWADR